MQCWIIIHNMPSLFSDGLLLFQKDTRKGHDCYSNEGNDRLRCRALEEVPLFELWKTQLCLQHAFLLK